MQLALGIMLNKSFLTESVITINWSTYLKKIRDKYLPNGIFSCGKILLQLTKILVSTDRLILRAIDEKAGAKNGCQY